MTERRTDTAHALSALREDDLAGLREIAAREHTDAAPPEAAPGAPHSARYQDALETAAFLGSFDPYALLPGARKEDLEALVRVCSVSSANGRSEWRLKSSVRTALLTRLSRQGQALLQRAASARDFLHGALNDPIARATISLVTGSVPSAQDLLRMARAEIAGYKAVLEWLKDIAPQLGLRADPELLLADIQMTELLEPFRFLTGYDPQTGRDLFIGRDAELTQLRAFVDVLASQGIIESVMRASTRVFADDARELFIGGIGGIGKSTLLAKFILQHVGRVPGLHFVYLDFDRSSISPVQPLTMLLEMMRQLGWQFPTARGTLEALRADARAEARSDAGNPGSAPAQPSFAGPGNPALPAELLGPTALLGYLTRLNRILEDASPSRERPFLLVLDTFEEVQALGDEGVARVQAFLDIAKDTLSPLRIVLVGRDTADGFFPDARRLVLQEYDQASRRVFLEARGVPSRISAKVARTVGGRPLALQLAARLVRDMGEEAVSLSVGERLKGFFSSALIEGVLYRRILDHIHDPDVRRIAHPGLVLRRLNAEVIEMVLIPALELKDFDKRKIAQVMAALRNQKDLVRVEADGSVTHRPDVREQMLALMVAEDAARVRALHHAAACYYRWKQEQPGDADGRENARVEEIYHLLGAGESLGRIPALWIAKARVALGFAVQELFLPGARGTLKVMLGRTPTEEEEAGLPPELLSQHVLGVAAASLAGNQPERGLQYLNRYAGHVPADTRKELFARLLDRAGYWKDALPFYRELLDAAGRIPHALMLDVADFFERQRAVMEERSELLACLRERERELTASSGGDMLRVSLALWRLQLRLEQPPDGLPPYLDEVLSGDAQLRRSRLRDDDLRWLVTLTPKPHPRLLRLAVPSRMTDSMAGQLRFLAALASGALQLPEELRTACTLAETLEESGSLKADFAFLPPQRTMEDAYWMLLRHVLRPATPQWYVPFASVLLDERGTVTPEALCGDMLPLLPFHAPKRLQSTKSLADFLGQLDELGILQIVLQGRTGRALSADSRRGEPLLLAYLAWRETYFRDMDGRMRYLLQAYMRGRGASK